MAIKSEWVNLQIVQEGTLGKAALNSAIISVGTTLLTLLLGVPTAYGIDRVRGTTLTVGLGALVLLQMIPQTATLIFILAWGEFLYAISILTDPDTYPISALISQQISAYGTSWSGLMALAGGAHLCAQHTKQTPQSMGRVPKPDRLATRSPDAD
jgi:ABC-type glycerol-3-phosphate transport system permease component